jgi:hypothetical protein
VVARIAVRVPSIKNSWRRFALIGSATASSLSSSSRPSCHRQPLVSAARV